MDVTKVKEAWKTIHSAERELAVIVKDCLELGKTIQLSKTLSKEETLGDFSISIQNNELDIVVHFYPSCCEENEYYYKISCGICGIYDFEPVHSKQYNAQGKLDITYWAETDKDGRKEQELRKTTISLRYYYD